MKEIIRIIAIVSGLAFAVISFNANATEYQHDGYAIQNGTISCSARIITSDESDDAIAIVNGNLFPLQKSGDGIFTGTDDEGNTWEVLAEGIIK